MHTSFCHIGIVKALFVAILTYTICLPIASSYRFPPDCIDPGCRVLGAAFPDVDENSDCQIPAV